MTFTCLQYCRNSITYKGVKLKRNSITNLETPPMSFKGQMASKPMGNFLTKISQSALSQVLTMPQLLVVHPVAPLVNLHHMAWDRQNLKPSKFWVKKRPKLAGCCRLVATMKTRQKPFT